MVPLARFHKSLARLIAALMLGVCISHVPAHGQTVESLQQDLQTMKREFEALQRQQAERIEELERQLRALQAAAPAIDPAAGRDVAVATKPQTDTAVESSAVFGALDQPARSLADPIGWGDDQRYARISFDGLFAAGASTADDLEALQLGGHDPNANGFTVQNLELTLDGSIDPYFRGQANIIYLINSEGESAFEVEEAFMETLSLPGNLQLKAGQFFTEFGRQNNQHPHVWHFADTPLVSGRFFGGDGLRNPGARISWLAPTPFYSELLLAVQNSHGETAQSFRSEQEGELYLGRRHENPGVDDLGDLLLTPRYVTSFDLTETQTIVAGASAALGPNASGVDQETRIYGLDLYWKWRPTDHHGGFPFVALQTEAMWRRYQAGAFTGDLDGDGVNEVNNPAETLKDHGMYAQLLYGFKRGWVAGLRGDWLDGQTALYGPDPDRDPRWRISPNLTWYPSEYSKVRLQYNYDDRDRIGVDHSIWLQMEFLLGDHAAHSF